MVKAERGREWFAVCSEKQTSQQVLPDGSECCLGESEHENREQQREEEEPDKGDRRFRKDEESSTVAIGCSTGKQIKM